MRNNTVEGEDRVPDIHVTTTDLVPRPAALILGTAPLLLGASPATGHRDAGRPDPPGDPRRDVTRTPEETA